MKRRAFLSALGTGLVALNLTLGFKPSRIEEPVPAPVEDLYRMVVCLKAAEDLEVGDVVARHSSVVDYVVVDKVAKATNPLDWFGISETKTSKGQMASVIRGFSAVRYIGA